METSIPPETPATPPPYSPPPVILPSTPPKPPRKGRGWMILAIVLFALLVFSLMANFGQMVSGLSSLSPSNAGKAGPRLEEALLKNNDSHNKIAVIPIAGIITGNRIDGTSFNLVDVVKEELRRADEDNRVKAVVLKVDSPGGEVLASDEIARAIREFQEDTAKPVVASMGNLAASGGYYVSAPCRWIVANDMTITGSIGVIMSGLNYRGLMDKVGLTPNVYKSGKFKDMLSGSRKPEDIPPEEREMVQNLINEVYGKFTNVVVSGRSEAHKLNKSNGRALSDQWINNVDGRVLSGSQAYELGFVDELGGFDVAVDSARELAGISNANLVEYKQIIDFADIFRMFGKSEPKTLKVDLGIDIPKLKAGQPYFLSPVYLN